MRFLRWLLDRLDEPSTWIALAAILGGIGFSIDDPQSFAADAVKGVAAVMALVAAFKREKGASK